MIPRELREILNDAIITHLDSRGDHANALIDLVASLSTMNNQQLTKNRLEWAENALLEAHGWRYDSESVEVSGMAKGVWWAPTPPVSNNAYRRTLALDYYPKAKALALTRLTFDYDVRFYEPIGDLTNAETGMLMEAQRIAIEIGSTVETALRNAGQEAVIERAIRAGFRLDVRQLENLWQYTLDQLLDQLLARQDFDNALTRFQR